ncbi:MAG: ABC transporter substrate-binding protein [Lachnospiraceae bacterium]|nr:ABC transporter substrate-binding protein [Lachnospiraceae bacterium]
MKAIGRAAIWLILSIWIIMAAGCAGSDTAQREEGPVCWASAQLQGGSGKAFVETPCPVYKKEGTLCALITWSSDHYDYMIVNEKKLLQVNTEGNAQFMVPLGSLEEIAGEAAGAESGGAEMLPDALGGTSLEIDVQADTTAMSTPHLIDYTLSFVFYKTQEEAEGAGTGVDEAGEAEKASQTLSGEKAPDIDGLTFLSKDENVYAECFAIYRYEGGYAVLSVDDGRRYLIVPEGGAIPEGTDGQGGGAVLKDEDGQELIVLQQPLDRIYLAASAAMCQFDEIGAVRDVVLSGLEWNDWYIESAREAMDEGTLSYGGKYSEPDYEKIIEAGVNLAVESTMILHAPKVQEKLELLGIPVFIDRSSYESEPLGRAEWVRVYGLLTGREEEAAKAFDEQKGYAEALAPIPEGDTRSLAVFSINAARQVVTRSREGYLGKMVEIAGGTLCTPVLDSSLATETVSMESFYAAAEDADILIYNASIEDAPEDLAELCAKDSILTQFRAVSEGHVWCMRSSLYQNANRTGAILRDLHAIVTGEAGDETEFFYRLK